MYTILTALKLVDF